jgi:tRNA:m4X modification enzyme
MLVKPGKKLCGEHDIVNNIDLKNGQIEDSSGVRIVCPNDDKHTCNANRLEKHLKVCPARPKPEPEYCMKGINLSSCSKNEEIEIPLTVNSVDDNYLIDVIDRIEKFYNSQCFDQNIQTDILKHNVVENYIKENPTFGPAALKHLEQNSSLLAILEKDIIIGVSRES